MHYLNNEIKFFTIYLSVFYILGLVGVFYNIEILIGFILLIVVILKFDYKKAIVLYLIFLLGFIRAKDVQNISCALDNIKANKVIIKGRVVSYKTISKRNSKMKFYLKANSAYFNNEQLNNINYKLLVSIDLENDIEDKILIGDYIEIKGNLRPPKPATNPYQFDYKKYLLNNDTKNIIYVKALNIRKCTNINSNKYEDYWYKILAYFEITRNKIIEKHSKYIKSPNLEILAGLVFGNETINPDEEIKESFKNSGLLHLLAASGLNVALIYGIWWWCAGLISLPYYLSILIGSLFVIVYTFMTGFPPSILRASLMLLFVLYGKMINGNSNSVNLIFFVAFLILLFCPKMLFDIGFQLSFAVTLGLIVSCPVVISKFEKADKKFKKKFLKHNKIFKYVIYLFSPKSLASIVAVPLIAQIWVIPLQIHYFNNIAPFSILANIAVIPFIGLLSFIGFIGSIIALVPYLNNPMIYIFDMIANPLLCLLVKISVFFSSFKYSLIKTTGFNCFQIFIFWAIASILVINIKHNFKNKIQRLSLIILTFVFLLSFIKINNNSNSLEIIMFDVQNADCFLIKTPKNKFIMIDTAKKGYKAISNAEIIMNKYMKNERIKTLENIIVTHFDNDHCGGVIDILDNFKVKNVLLQDKYLNSFNATEILNYLKKNKINYSFARNNELIYSEDDLTLRTFVSNKINTENEASTISLLTYKDKNILFMADASYLAFNDIQKYIPSKIDILKVGHHGAKNSLNNYMLDKIKPDYALIPAGNVDFNHPHLDTIKLLSNKNIKTLASKNYGFIKIIINKDIKIYNFDKKLKEVIFEDIKNTFSLDDFIKKL